MYSLLGLEGSFWTLKWPFWTILDSILPKMTILDHFGLDLAILGIPRSRFRDLEICEPILPKMTILGIFISEMAILGILDSEMVISSDFRIFHRVDYSGIYMDRQSVQKGLEECKFPLFGLFMSSKIDPVFDTFVQNRDF